MNDFFNQLVHKFELPLSSPILVFSLILSIILLSPILLKKVNIPGIIGLILSGVIIGPHGFNILEKNSAVDLFSTIGLLYIMFIAGLELDMNEFKANRNKSVLFGLFTFIFPILVGFPVCHYVLGYNFNASFLTASMFATHTLVAYPIVSKLGVSKNQAVAVAVGGTILTDTAVLILLAVIMGNHEGSLDGAFWIRMGVSLAIFSVIMFLVIPKIAKWFFRKLESEKHSHYIFVLSVLFLAAFLAEVAGLESIIGAFVAGLALNKLIPHSSALMNRIGFIGNALFIPFFLISVGMIVDVRIILSGPMALIVAGVLTVVSLFGKWLAALLTQWSFSYTGAQRQLLFGLSSAHAAATLAVILVGFKAGIIDETILNGTIILILITCIVASFVAEKAAKKILLSGDVANDGADKNQAAEERILIPTINEAMVDRLLEFSFLIKDRKTASPITLLSIVPNDTDAEENVIRSRKKLEEFITRSSAHEVRVNPMITIDHNPVNGIARISREILADIVVMGWPTKTSFFDKLLGDGGDAIVMNIDKNLMICHFVTPFVSQKRILLLTPALAEKENGFKKWVHKIANVARELSLPIVHYGDEKTQAAVQEALKQHKTPISVSYKWFAEWDDFLVLSRNVQPDDCIVFVSSRKGAISYLHKLESIPIKLEKYFDKNNKILVYPQQNDPHFLSDKYEDFSANPFTKGMETLGQIGKGIGTIFKGDKPE